ncbi:ribosome recycling factor [Gigaspora margarita]|uniref:Ribosome recycling factor n=1 Tax=Gigaspora margarita TaxID=4874 RepID=A0A8H4APV4_GIGMA|nr:ribosome recycling factor [Gigaspora margarita]
MFLRRILFHTSRDFISPLTFTLSFPSDSSFTGQRRLLASKKKAGEKSGGKRSKVAFKEENDVEDEEGNASNRTFDLTNITTKMNTILGRLKKEYGTMRIGQANPAILDSVMVPYENGSAPLRDLTQIIVKDPQTLLVHVHDEEMLKTVDKAIRSANLNLNPMIDGKGLKVPIPKITTEFREKMIKVASKIAENTKIKLRLARQDGLKDLKKDSKNGLPSDETKLLEKQLQLLIDKYVKDVDDSFKAKSKEISGN